jgi:hypothetical protein
MTGKYVAPSIHETAFNCPHCHALTTQVWYRAVADKVGNNETVRCVPRDKSGYEVATDLDAELRASIEQYVDRLATGRPFLSPRSGSLYPDADLENVSVSSCYNCTDIAIWLYDRLVWPARGEVPLPNADLPGEIRDDYDEAGGILDRSPRGAAALLRLAIQKLCVHLGESGKSINDDIASLVAKGLDVKVQQSLDIVRVVGNESVHPGTLDLRDDRATAEKLFGLVNLIAEIMISRPKHVKELYESLPAEKRDAIEKRDKKKP